MRITWSVPVPGETMDSGRGDIVRAARLIAAVRDAGHDVQVVHAGRRRRTVAAVSAYRGIVRRVLPAPVALAARDLGRVAHARTHARQVALAAQRQRADLIIETQVHLSDCGARAARACGLPLVLDDCSPVGEESVLGSGIDVLARTTFARQARAAAAMSVSSPELRQRLVEEGIPCDKITVIPNGVDLETYHAATRDAARRHFGLGDAPVLVFVGSFQPWHRLDLLMKAVSLINDAPAPRLLLAGDGPALSSALDVARALGVLDRVVSLGTLPPSQIPSVLSAGDIGVLSGTNDYGQPMKLLEYAAAGLPAVAPDLPTVRALVMDSETGLLFAPGEPEAMARALARLLADPWLRHGLGVAARQRVTADAGWSERGRDLAAMAEQVLSRSAPC